MRRGNDARLVFDEHGRLVAIATGSDATTEHECGSKPLLAALCEQPAADEVLIARLAKGKPVRYPSLLESKRITKFPKELQFIEVPKNAGSPPQAILGLCRRPLHDFKEDLRFWELPSEYHDNDVAGAWCEDAFAIRVRTEKYVNALKGFDKALRAGKVLFAGLFFKHARLQLSGVILARSDYLSAENLAAAKEAQAKYESGLRLKARDDSDQVLREMQRLMGSSWIGFLGARWTDETESGLHYWFNPGHGVNASHGGYYSKEALLAWARAKGSYRLSASRAA